MLALLTWMQAHAHSGAVPVRGVYDWSQLPDLEPGAWIVWDTYPSIVLGCLGLVVLYELLAGPLKAKVAPQGAPPTTGERVAFYAAVFTIFGALQGPIHELSDLYLFSGHMVQHLLITLVFPPLFLRGVPGWMWDPLLKNPTVLAIGKVLTKPLVAALVGNAALFIWHAPAMYDWALRDHNVHIAEHLSFMITFVIMWWPVLSKNDRLPRLAPMSAIVYLFLSNLPMKLLGLMITTSRSTVLYTFYATQPRVFGLDPLQDQLYGGLIMWIPPMFVVWGSMGVIFFRHYASDTHQSPSRRAARAKRLEAQ